MTAPALLWRWDGRVMVPQSPKLAAKDFKAGESYRLAEEHERSQASHRAYFAAVNQAHANLPDDLLEDLPTPEHLRKVALIKCGFADERSIVCASKAEAIRIAAFVRPMDSYAIVATQGTVVKVWTAHSQNMRAMDRAVFQDSKQKVLDYCARLIGVKPSELARQGEAA